MSLSPQEVNFDVVWGNLRAGIQKLVTLQSTSGMPLFEYVLLDSDLLQHTMIMSPFYFLELFH